MTTTEERLRILQMIQEGKISAEEGAGLLQALSSGAKMKPPTPTRDPRLLRVRITNLESGKTMVNVNVPISLVNVGVKLGARFAPTSTEIDYDEIMQAIRNGVGGKIVDVEDVESHEHVEIWVE
ncbi:MAG: hypothetical protein JXJ20_13860 [Anaerolineae bacterium]|jgi:hypothetical protein|nr:hypothetical protein [Anaerolineae bacterium]